MYVNKPPIKARLLSYLLVVFFDQLYHRFAWTYDGVAALVSLGLWQEWALAVLPYLQGPRLLELGHGPGHLQQALWQRGLQPVGLDASRQMGRLARRRLARYPFQLVHSYAQNLPFSAAVFHQVVATFPTEYIAHPDTLAEIYRVLTPGGQLIILPAAWITGRRPDQRLAAWLFRTTGQAPATIDLSAIAAQALPPLEQAGFDARINSLSLPHSLLLLVHAVKKS